MYILVFEDKTSLDVLRMKLTFRFSSACSNINKVSWWAFSTTSATTKQSRCQGIQLLAIQLEFRFPDKIRLVVLFPNSSHIQLEIVFRIVPTLDYKRVRLFGLMQARN
jgi:hypothetical protein